MGKHAWTTPIRENLNVLGIGFAFLFPYWSDWLAGQKRGMKWKEMNWHIWYLCSLSYSYGTMLGILGRVKRYVFRWSFLGLGIVSWDSNSKRRCVVSTLDFLKPLKKSRRLRSGWISWSDSMYRCGSCRMVGSMDALQAMRTRWHTLIMVSSLIPDRFSLEFSSFSAIQVSSSDDSRVSELSFFHFA
jgi:hypothetical protein